eukprot:6046684-Lingulodinium_polyedra.AAC.1
MRPHARKRPDTRGRVWAHLETFGVHADRARIARARRLWISCKLRMDHARMARGRRMDCTRIARRLACAWIARRNDTV